MSTIISQGWAFSDVDFIYNGKNLSKLAGWAGDKAITIAPARTFASVNGPDGARVRHLTGDFSAHVSITIFNTSPINDYLMTQLVIDVNTPSVVVAGALNIKDHYGTFLLNSQAWLDGAPADFGFGAAPQVVTWAWDCTNGTATSFYGGRAAI